MNEEVTYSTPDELTLMLREDRYIKEFCNYLHFEELSKVDAYCKTFRMKKPLGQSQQVRMYRWVKKKAVQEWLQKSIKSLEVDWIDKRVNALQHLYGLGTNAENSEKTQIDALDKFLSHLNREENKIRLDMNGSTQVNIVQIVQDKLATITRGATIQPDLLSSGKEPTLADKAIDAILVKEKVVVDVEVVL